MRALLSIKPEYAEKIFSGEKGYEFRKTIFRRNVTTIVVYVTLPVGKIVGEFEISHILVDNLASLWSKTKNKAGISQAIFYEYFKGKELGVAIEIGKIKKYRQVKDPYIQDANFIPPQSFRYLATSCSLF